MSKTKCLFLCGKPGNIQYPVPLLLHGRELPWVKTGTHLGHELHQLCNMEHDAKCKRASFINNSTNGREMFSFAYPSQILGAVSIYTCHFYGAMLLDLFGETAGQVFRAWNTCVKLAWDVPRRTHNYFVDNLLSGPLPSVREKLLSQYVGFFKNLQRSSSWEVRILSEIVGSDVASNTGRNLVGIEEEFGKNPRNESPGSFKRTYKGYMVPREDSWRLTLLGKFLEQRREMVTCGEDSSTITDLINALCIS